MRRPMRSFVVALCAFVAALGILSPAVAAAAESKKEKQRDKRELHKDQARLDALEREEKDLKSQVGKLEKQLPAAQPARQARERGPLDRQAVDRHSPRGRSGPGHGAGRQAALAEVVKRIEEGQPTDSPFGLRGLSIWSRGPNRRRPSRPSRTRPNTRRHARRPRSRRPPSCRRCAPSGSTRIRQSSPREKLAEAKEVYEKRLDELLRKDPAWQRTSREEERTRDRETDAEKRLNGLATLNAKSDRARARPAPP